MTLVSFSMQDIQAAWENGGQDAYFAATPAYQGATPMVFASEQMQTKPGKALQKVAIKGENGLMHYGLRMKKFGEGVAIGTANNVGKGIKSAGSGVANAGGFVRDRANQLGGVIRRNPRTAGAVILGGTALGVGGGAYANSRRGNN